MNSEVAELRAQIAELRQDLDSLSCEVTRLRRLLARGLVSEGTASRASSEADHFSETGYSFVSAPAVVATRDPAPSVQVIWIVLVTGLCWIGRSVNRLQREWASFCSEPFVVSTGALQGESWIPWLLAFGLSCQRYLRGRVQPGESVHYLVVGQGYRQVWNFCWRFSVRGAAFSTRRQSGSGSSRPFLASTTWAMSLWSQPVLDFDRSLRGWSRFASEFELSCGVAMPCNLTSQACDSNHSCGGHRREGTGSGAQVCLAQEDGTTNYACWMDHEGDLSGDHCMPTASQNRTIGGHDSEGLGGLFEFRDSRRSRHVSRPMRCRVSFRSSSSSFRTGFGRCCQRAFLFLFCIGSSSSLARDVRGCRGGGRRRAWISSNVFADATVGNHDGSDGARYATFDQATATCRERFWERVGGVEQFEVCFIKGKAEDEEKVGDEIRWTRSGSPSCDLRWTGRECGESSCPLKGSSFL